MIDNNKKFEPDSVNYNESTATSEIYDFGDVESKKDWQELWERAYSRELLRRDGDLENNEKKYEAALVNVITDKNGNIDEEIVLFTRKYENGQLYIKNTAFHYDSLPSDVQEAIGRPEDVIDQWIPVSEHQIQMHDKFMDYTDNSKGFDTWEEYRDANGLVKGSDIEFNGMKYVSDVEDIDIPRATPNLIKDDNIEIITK